MRFLSESSNKTTCPWKGTASYYNVSVGVNEDAALYYPGPSKEAIKIKGNI